MWLLVGLGNPGREYEDTRHNVGFLVLDELARRHQTDAPKSKFGGEIQTVELARGGQREKGLLLKPMEFMNLSGRAVGRTAAFFQVPPAQWVVVHDEIDLVLGRLQVKVGGGHAGHNGVRSIMSETGSPDFLRLRIGVGRPQGRREAAGHVLGGFTKAESQELSIVIQEAADAVETMVLEGVPAAMNRFNKRKDDKKQEQAKQ
jgi:PTH1 family peptidyl-tRNA hydrolase